MARAKSNVSVSAIVDAKTLAASSKRVSDAAGKSPATNMMMIKFENGRINLTATDMDREISETIFADVQNTGTVFVNAVKIASIAAGAPSGAEISLTLKENLLHIKYMRSIFKLETLDMDDFPTFSMDNLPYNWTMPIEEFVRIIGATSHAVATDESRSYLHGVHLHILKDSTGSYLAAVATDGHRCCRRVADIPHNLSDLPPVIIPSNTVSFIMRTYQKTTGDVAISLNDRCIRIEMGNIHIASKLIDGVFPDYVRVIPAGNDKTCVVHGEVLADAIGRIMPMIEGKARVIGFIMKNDRLLLAAETKEGGFAGDEIDAEFNGDKLIIGFNANYVLEALANISGDVVIPVSDKTSPAIFMSDLSSPALEIVMPLAINQKIDAQFTGGDL